MLHITCFGLVSIMSISWQMTEGLGYPQFNAVATGFCTAVGISLMVILTGDLGNIGIAIGRLTGFAIIFFSIFVVEKWFFKKVQVRFWIRLSSSLIMAALFAAFTEYTIDAFLPSVWSTLLLSLFLGGFVYCFILWMLDFVTADEKLLIRQVLTKESPS